MAKLASEKKWTKTLLGRHINLTKRLTPKARSSQAVEASMTDILLTAMVKLDEMKELDYYLVLTRKNELILEGPEEHADKA